MKIRLFKPHLGTEELNAVKEVFDNSWIGLGPKVSEFENNFGAFNMDEH
jgi:perosamine synthetase